MGCEIRQTPTGTMIICGRGRRPSYRCYVCQKPTDILCDKDLGNPSFVCDRPICLKHGRRVASNTDWCNEHTTAV